MLGNISTTSDMPTDHVDRAAATVAQVEGSAPQAGIDRNDQAWRVAMKFSPRAWNNKGKRILGGANKWERGDALCLYLGSG